MVQVSYPGVYIQEVSSGVHTITGVATSIAAFFGRASEGPVGQAIRLLSYADFERKFGRPLPESELAHAVRLFFLNGGTDCYVTRLIKAGTGQKASLMLKNEAGADVLRLTAKEIGAWGNSLSFEVDFATARPEDTFHLRIFRFAPDGNVVSSEEFLNLSMDKDNSRFAPAALSQGSSLVDAEWAFANAAAADAAAPNAGFSQSRRLFTNDQAGRDAFAAVLAAAANTSKLRLSVDGSPYFDVDLADAFAAGAAEADILTAVTARINASLPASLLGAVAASFADFPAAGPATHRLLQLTSNTAAGKSVSILPGSSKDAAGALLLGADQGGLERARYGALRPAPTGIFFSLNRLDALSNLFQNDFDTLTLEGKSIALSGASSLVSNPPGNASRWYQAASGNDGVRQKLAVMAAAINGAGVGWSAKVAGYRLLLARKSGTANLSPALGFAGATATPDATWFIANTRLYTLGVTGAFTGAATPGLEGVAPDVAAYTGSPDLHSGFYALDTVDLFNLMILPYDAALSEDQFRGLWAPASVYCASRRAFLLIDSPQSWDAGFDKAVDPSKGIRQLRIGADKDHAAVFYPHIRISDAGLLKTIGAAGAIAGLMARTDANRGVWKAPAGTEASLFNVTDLALKLTDLENGVLNKEGVNCIRLFPNGIVNWGARTLDGADDFGSEWKYVPIRRLALFLEESLFRGTKWAVFEPNDEPLWAKIRQNLGAFMNSLFRQGAFQGTSPQEAYFVKCDKETTTQNDRNLGIVNIEVGFAPLKPAEFVVIKIQQIAGDLG
ncbi:MAG TPA: phage tail sheath C-terminal domain-containing protein [Fibrobacteria bacterium]|nr:phage tail sheath C-terminal domain-containing protein [Fibrobacteria bacterium]